MIKFVSAINSDVCMEKMQLNDTENKQISMMLNIAYLKSITKLLHKTSL